MGKGYNNFMSKKAFHPGSYANQKRIHEAEAKTEAKRKHDEETLAQYQKEQELFNQKSLVSKQSKDKLSLSFMYEAPAGVEKSDEKKNEKVEWKSSSSKSDTPSKTQEICLEWKRDKPVKKDTVVDGEKFKQEIIKQEIKKETKVKEEPCKDLKYKRIKEEIEANKKRVKNER